MKTKIGLTLVIATIMGGLILPVIAQENKQPEINAFNLQNAFQKEENPYKGKIVIITGVVTHVGPDVYGLPSIELSDKAGGKMYVLCVLPALDYLKLRKVSKGDKVRISGEARGLHSDDFVVVKNCRII